MNLIKIMKFKSFCLFVVTIIISNKKVIATLKTEIKNGFTYMAHSIADECSPSKVMDGKIRDTNVGICDNCVVVGDYGVRKFTANFIGIVFPKMKLIESFILYGLTNLTIDINQKHWIVGLNNQTIFDMEEMLFIGMYTPLATGLNSGIIFEDFPTPANSIWIYQRPIEQSTKALCEIDIKWFTCDANKFGYKCLSECNCANNDPCDDITGDCPANCEYGWQGDQCDIISSTTSSTTSTTTKTTKTTPSTTITDQSTLTTRFQTLNNISMFIKNKNNLNLKCRSKKRFAFSTSIREIVFRSKNGFDVCFLNIYRFIFVIQGILMFS